METQSIKILFLLSILFTSISSTNAAEQKPVAVKIYMDQGVSPEKIALVGTSRQINWIKTIGTTQNYKIISTRVRCMRADSLNYPGSDSRTNPLPLMKILSIDPKTGFVKLECVRDVPSRTTITYLSAKERNATIEAVKGQLDKVADSLKTEGAIKTGEKIADNFWQGMMELKEMGDAASDYDPEEDHPINRVAPATEAISGG